MIAFYSNGAGLGHLSRTLKSIQALAIQSPCIIISNSAFINEHKFVALNQYCQQQSIELKTLPLTSGSDHLLFRQKLLELLNKKQVKTLYIDCFPVGIYGELNGLTRSISNIKVHLLARLLKWKQYQPLLKMDNQFHTIYNVESLLQAQLNYNQQHSQVMLDLTLENLSFPERNDNLPIKTPYCLIVHSGCEDEVMQLINYSKQKLRYSGMNYQIVIASPWPLINVSQEITIIQIQCYPINNWLKNAEVIVSGAGFNIMNEVSKLEVTHWVLPFERKYDDQFARLANSSVRD